MKNIKYRTGFVFLTMMSAVGVIFLTLFTLNELPVFARRPARPFVVDSGGLQELSPGFDYQNWYQQQTGYAPDSIYFGVYSAVPVADRLYLGFGTGRPAEYDGALLAVTDGATITAVSPLTEQGFIDMQAMAGTVYIPGADPCCSDGWELGNFYVKAPSQPITKHRNLPNVIHAWGVWIDEVEDIVYTAVSAHLGDNETLTGAVFSSTNQGNDWVQVGNYQDGLGAYRTYDIIGFADRLYAIWNDIDPNTACGLTVSEDAGLTWTRLTTSHPLACRSRLHVWQNQLLALAHDQKSLIAISEDQQLVERPFTEFVVPAWSYHPFAHDEGGYLYTMSQYGDVLRTADLLTWEPIAKTNLDLFGITYWPARDKLVLSERGNGRLWTLDLMNVVLFDHDIYLPAITSP